MTKKTIFALVTYAVLGAAAVCSVRAQAGPAAPGAPGAAPAGGAEGPVQGHEVQGVAHLEQRRLLERKSRINRHLRRGQRMPKLFEYFGLIVLFYSNEHDQSVRDVHAVRRAERSAS